MIYEYIYLVYMHACYIISALLHITNLGGVIQYLRSRLFN